MRPTAIRTYQGGGAIEYDIREPTVPFQQAEEPNVEIAQAPPPAPMPAPAKPPGQAFDPNALVKPATPVVDTDPDADINIWKEREQSAFHDPATTKIFSHRGDNPQINQKDRGEFSLQAHPEYERFRQAVELYNAAQRPEYAGQISKQQMRTMNSDIARMEARMRKEQTQKYNDFHEKEKIDARRVDAMPLPYGQEEKMEDSINKALTDYDTRRFGANFSTAQERNAAQEMRAGSIYNTTTRQPTELQSAIRNIYTLNRDKLGVNDAAMMAIIMGQPVKPGAKGFNGLNGRAAANFDLMGRDSIGNRFVVVNTDSGPRKIRMNESTYDFLNGLRYDGYKKIIEHQKKLDEARKPGMLGRALEWSGKQLGIE